LVAWQGILVDGHHRHQICERHRIPFAIDHESFSDRRLSKSG
jgi:hypothetical protein